MAYAAAFVLAAVVSLDGLVVGMVYGARGITLSRKARIIVSAASALTMGASMLLGGLLAQLLTARTAERLGALFLMVLGAVLILRARIGLRAQNNGSAEPVKLAEFRLPVLGVIIHILKDPEAADVDHSGSISSGEAVVLGVALALDALGAGLGAGLSSMPVAVVVASVGLMKLCLLSVGLRCGKSIYCFWPQIEHSCVPGVLLLALGVYNIL